ncbi:MAG: DMT family transporter [Pseudomonadota bacterium]|nr:DMT family transporter [Pseudomonadota bacterium]
MSGTPARTSLDHSDVHGAAGLFALSSFIWGSTWLAITFQLGHVAPEVSVAYRFALAALMLGGWCIVRGRSLRLAPRVHVMLAAQGALMFGLNYVAIYKAEQHIASGLVAVLFSTIVFTSLIATRIAFGTPITARALIGATLGVGGVALLFLPQLAAAAEGAQPIAGIGYALLGTALATGGNLVSMRMQGQHLPILPTTALGMAYGAIFAAVIATILGVPWTFEWNARYIASLLYLAFFGSVIAFGAYLTLLQRVGAGPSSYIAVTTPVLAMLLSSAVEGYRWTTTGGIGVVLAVAGNVLVLRRPRDRRP